jgi:alpha-ribazole phosphatase
MKVYIIRHTSVDVPKGVCYGQTDVPVRETFEEEARQVAANLEGLKFDKVYCSPLSRCRRLAEFCGYADAQLDKRLLEMNFGEWEMQRYDEITDPRIQAWYDDYYNLPATGGESFADQRRRLEDFFEELKQQDYQTVAIFAHGGIQLQAMLIKGMVTPDNAFAAQPPYGGIIQIELFK